MNFALSISRGAQQLGDLGTKAFHKPRLQELLRLWGLRAPTDPPEQREKGSVARAEVNGTVAVLAKLVILLGWMVQGSRASTVGRGTGLEVSFPWELIYGWSPGFGCFNCFVGGC